MENRKLLLASKNLNHFDMQLLPENISIVLIDLKLSFTQLVPNLNQTFMWVFYEVVIEIRLICFDNDDNFRKHTDEIIIGKVV